MRGCTRGCRFCHAGMVNRPVRERHVEEVLNAIQDAVNITGLEEVGLLSLSSSDYTHINDLLKGISDLQKSPQFNHQRVSISLPSLRIESFTSDLLDAIQDARRHGFTLAPEAGTTNMRMRINKPIQDDMLMNSAREIFSNHFTTIKLYFMIGLPQETDDDIIAIAELCRQVMTEGRRILGGKAKVNVGVSTFVPKPHTPFQWVECNSTEVIHNKISLLRRTLSDRSIKLTWNDAKETRMEAVLSRGDRRLAQVIFSAWQAGAKFDAWQDHFNEQAWQKAFQENHLEAAFYAYRVRPYDEIFPWDHIDAGVSKKYLLKDYQKSIQGASRQDCRNGCYGCGISLTNINAFHLCCAQRDMIDDKE